MVYNLGGYFNLDCLFLLMKQIAFILSFFILSLSIIPMVKLLHGKYSPEYCSKSCTNNPDSQKDSDGCKKQTCSPFSCSFKTLIIVQSIYQYPNQFIAEFTNRNTYITKAIFVSIRSFEIWHPPKIV